MNARVFRLALWVIPAAAGLFAQSSPQRPNDDLSSLPIEELAKLQVEGAALHRQSLQEAPANVTILTAQDLYRYGYRTLGEALASVRSFYSTNDRTYRSVGVRGFGPPGDYGSRILVMVNGHNMADNVFDSNLWFGPDFPIDMSLVQRIEIIRGPTSALYGSNGILASINIITKTPESIEPAVTVQTGSFGERKANVAFGLPLGKRVHAAVAATVFNNAGESPLYFPALDTPENNFGRALRMDSESGYHFFATAGFGNWSFTSAVSRRNKIQPISWGPTVFNDRGTKVMEPSGYFESVYTRERSDRVFRWRTYYSATHLRGRFDYPVESGIEDYQTCSCGDWIGTQVDYRFGIGRFGLLTTGAAAKIDLRVLQSAKDVAPVATQYARIDQRDRSIAVFAQDEILLSGAWKLDLGVRADASAYRRSFVSPRAALIWQPGPWTWKLLYGRAFRNPSAFHLFYEDGFSAMANPHLRPENADTVEMNIERKIGKRWNLLAAGYRYWMRDFLSAVYTPEGFLQYQNLGGARAAGLEFEIAGHPWGKIETVASYEYQRAIDSSTRITLPNSAEHQGKVRFAVPLHPKWWASSTMQFRSGRKTLWGDWLDPVALGDLTVASTDLMRNLDVRFGVRNVWDQRYADPIALDSRLDRMPQAGRTFFVEIVARVGW